MVIPSRNGKDLLAAMLPEVVRQIQSRAGGEIIVVDNGSDDGTADFLRERISRRGVGHDAVRFVICARGQRWHSESRAIRTFAC